MQNKWQLTGAVVLVRHLAVNSVYVKCEHTATVLKGLTDQQPI